MENLIPGFENFMEDTSVEVSVDVGDQEEVETALTAEGEETAAEQAEVTEAVAEEEQDAAAAEMIFRRFDEIAHMKMVAEKYGVDRTFLALCNRDDVLANQFRITLPSCESFDTVGDPRSAESQACVEGLGKVLSQIWEFIKKVCKKIKDFFVRLWDALVTRFISINGNIGRLRKAYDERQDDEKALKGNKKYTVTAVEVLLAKTADGKKIKGKLVDKTKDVLNLASALTKQVSSVTANESTSSISDKDIKDLKDFNNAIGEEIDRYKVKEKDKKSSLDKIAWSKIPTYLDSAAGIQKNLEEQKAIFDNVKHIAENMIKLADSAETRQDDGARAAGQRARDFSSAFNRYSSLVGTFNGVMATLASEIVRSVALRIRYGSKKRAGF